MKAVLVPSAGPLSVGTIYQRSDLHKRFGGNSTAGIVPSKSEPVVLLFHTAEAAQQFYGDGFDKHGVYWYSGMGTKGDMKWNYANKAVRDHLANGRDLYFFERFQREGGYWTLVNLMHCVGAKEEQRPDKHKRMRKAIIFGLVPISEGSDQPVNEKEVHSDLATLRLRAQWTSGDIAVQEAQKVQRVFLRSEAVRLYAMARAAGVCEVCGQNAPFITNKGIPFLEVHHIDRLSDGGPDRPDRVGGVCPNCHRRCHYGSDAKDYNDRLRKLIDEKETKLFPSKPVS